MKKQKKKQTNKDTKTQKLKRILKNQTHLSNCLFKNWLTESLRLRQSIKQREQENGPGSKIWPLRSIIWWARAENCWRTDEDWPIALIRSFSMTIPPFWKTRLWESIVTIAALWSKIIIADLVFSSPITCWFPYSSSIKSSWAGVSTLQYLYLLRCFLPFAGFVFIVALSFCHFWLLLTEFSFSIAQIDC